MNLRQPSQERGYPHPQKQQRSVPLRMGASALLLGLCLALAACQPSKVDWHPTPLGQVSDTIPSGHAITLDALLEKYNANAALAAKLYARTSLELAWEEVRKDGSRRTRHEPECSGKIIFLAPDNTAVTVEKLGTTYLWAGSDAKRYWLFDLTQDERMLYVGRLDGPAASHGLLGLPVRPQDVPILLGLRPIPRTPDLQLRWCVDKKGRELYLVERPGLRLLFAPGEDAPARVELTDAQGVALVVAEMSGLVDCGNGAKVRGKIAIHPEGRQDQLSRLDLTVDSAVAPSDKIKPRMFDLEGTLIPAHKPDKIVDLDKE